MSTGKLRLFFIIMVVATLSLIVFGQANKPHSYDSLVNKVERLERRLTELEGKVTQLESSKVIPLK